MFGFWIIIFPQCSVRFVLCWLAGLLAYCVKLQSQLQLACHYPAENNIVCFVFENDTQNK